MNQLEITSTTCNQIPCQGTCALCGEIKFPLFRTVFHFNVKCECHSPNHFDLVLHCSDCKPEKPRETKIELKRDENVCDLSDLSAFIDSIGVDQALRCDLIHPSDSRRLTVDDMPDYGKSRSFSFTLRNDSDPYTEDDSDISFEIHDQNAGKVTKKIVFKSVDEWDGE